MTTPLGEGGRLEVLTIPCPHENTAMLGDLCFGSEAVGPVASQHKDNACKSTIRKCIKNWSGLPFSVGAFPSLCFVLSDKLPTALCTEVSRTVDEF